jgi:AAHS family 4-hydroxybenzoate transporter-like MFS transporter
MASAGRLVERYGAAIVLVPALLVGAVATAALGSAGGSIAAMSAVLALVGLSVGMGASGSIGLAALIYPTAIRSSGIGWAMGMGRFGQVITPLLASAATAAGWSGGQLFLAIAVAPFAGALAIAAIRIHSRELHVERGI